MDCEICGAAPVVAKIKIDSAVLNVCHDCEHSGKPIPRLIVQGKPHTQVIRKPLAEEVLVVDYAKLIAHARRDANITQEELASKLNEKVPVIKAAESGKRLEIKLAKKLEKFFKLKLVEIV